MKYTIAITFLMVLVGCTTSPLAHNSGVLPIGKNSYSVTAVNATASSAKQDAINIATKHCALTNKSLEVNSIGSGSDAWGWHSADVIFLCR